MPLPIDQYYDNPNPPPPPPPEDNDGGNGAPQPSSGDSNGSSLEQRVDALETRLSEIDAKLGLFATGF